MFADVDLIEDVDFVEIDFKDLDFADVDFADFDSAVLDFVDIKRPVDFGKVPPSVSDYYTESA